MFVDPGASIGIYYGKLGSDAALEKAPAELLLRIGFALAS